MACIVVVGPATSGKTTTCFELSGVTGPLAVTYCAHYIATEVNGVEWHIWDTPSISDTDWAAEAVLTEADVVVVCYDGRAGEGPLPIVRRCGANRCVIALTRGAVSYVSCAVQYLRETRHDGTLVPVALLGVELIDAISSVIRRARPEDSRGFYELAL